MWHMAKKKIFYNGYLFFSANFHPFYTQYFLKGSFWVPIRGYIGPFSK